MPVIAALLGTLIYHRYTLFGLFDTVQADKGDSRYIAFMLEHWNTVVHGHAHPGSPLIFYPVTGTLGYSDALAGMGLVHVALRAVGLPVFIAMNVQLVLDTLASFGFAYLFLVRGFRIGVVAATAGAAFFAFSWPRFAALIHPQLQFTFLLPLMALLALECLRDGAALSRRGFAWRVLSLVALLSLTMATTVYYAEFFALFLALTLLPGLLHGSVRRALWLILKRHWPALLSALLLAALLAAPLARVYLPIMRQSGGRSWPDVARELLTPVDFLWMGRENLVWGWLFEHWPQWSVQKWSETRIGIGVIASAAWLLVCLAAAHTLLTLPRGPLPAARRDRAIASLIVLGAVLVQLCALRIGTFSAWWLIYQGFPGSGGLRGVERIELVATLPMALGFALLLESAMRVAGRRRAWVLVLLVAAAAAEQVGVVQRYSGRAAEAISQRVADAIPRDCKAAYVLGTPSMFPEAPTIPDEAHFDAAKYLQANLDVAANWKGSAWDHYRLFGRKEHRYLDPVLTHYHTAMTFFYNYTIPLGATLAGIPVVNGLSGWQPPGWDLFDVFAPDAPERMAQWMRFNHRDPADVCIVRLDMPYSALPEVELRDE